ncbi:MAG: patatin-like phospholipase family protein [Opitutaceae bacterium]|nr:patatin-like phospholipase family protein [Cytophagales bacterium]
MMLLIWFLLFGFVSQQLGQWMGIPYLFLDPEYMGNVDERSMFILGMSFGIFNMSFQLTSYILDSNRFNFLGTLPSPFLLFFQNNSIIPSAFILFYFYNFFQLQYNSGFENLLQIILEAGSFLMGTFLIKFILLHYFRLSNKDMFKLLANNLEFTFRQNKFNRVNVLKNLSIAKKSKYKVDYYYQFPLKLHPIDKTKSVDKSLLIKVFDQNHMNAVFIEVLIFVLIVLFGQFNDIPALQIPAGASAFIFFSFVIMLTGALSYWLKGWAISTVVIIFFSLNYFTKNGILKLDNEAFGINYHISRPEFSLEHLSSLSSDENYLADRDSTIKILENWKAKFPMENKPKMIFICTSGGGQRAAVWAFNALQVVDKGTDGELIKNCFLMTGASGGMIGSAFFRDLYYRYKTGKISDYHDEKYVDAIAKDVLNPLLFNFFVNDIFFRIRNFELNGLKYTKDRGFAFEQQLSRNTGMSLSRNLMFLAKPEKNAEIPMIILSPTVVNDGRKLYISPQNISYMCTAELSSKHNTEQRIKGIEFRRMYKDQWADSLRFMSGLRMSATFPYITPNVVLPSYPAMEIMDAGLSDNYGFTDAMRFLFVFRDWISKNTSGVVIVSIRDSDKETEVEKRKGQTIFEKFFNPIGSLYHNWDMLQDINNDNLVDYAKGWYPGNLDVINFQYKPQSVNIPKESKGPTIAIDKKDVKRASLSWHLTKREKESIKQSIYGANNVAALEKLKILLRQTDTTSGNKNPVEHISEKF